jgi:hypothetical protein
MDMIELFKLGSKFGIELVLVVAGCWVVAYLVKNTVVRLGVILDNLADKVDKLGDKLEKHDMQSDMRGQFIRKEHEALIRQHEGMIKTLGRINGYKGE